MIPDEIMAAMCVINIIFAAISGGWYLKFSAILGWLAAGSFYLSRTT